MSLGPQESPCLLTTRLPLPRHKTLLFLRKPKLIHQLPFPLKSQRLISGCLLPEGQVRVGHLVRTQEHQDLRVRAMYQEEEVGNPKGSLCCGVALVGERAKESLSLNFSKLKMKQQGAILSPLPCAK